MENRVIALEAVRNLRDFGGYDAGPGQKVKARRLLRSAHHAEASEPDQAALDALGLKVIVDLRRKHEQETQPRVWPRPDVGGVRVIAGDHGGDQEAPHMQMLRTSSGTPEEVRDFMVTTYALIPFDPAHVRLFQQTFEALSTGETPLLVHCAAGKDRTGVLCWLIHRALGVSEDDALADYLLTNRVVDMEFRLDQVARVVSERYGKTFSEASIRAFMGVEEAYLASAAEAIEARAGSVAGYLETVLGLDERAREAMALHLLQPAD